MKKIFQFIGVLVSTIIALLILIPILLTIVGVAVPVVLSILGVALFFVLIALAFGGIIALVVLWRFRKNMKDNDFEFVRNGKHFNIHINKDENPQNRRDVTNNHED
ncbi:hypothetical protein GCM10025879_17260 [Leuconostoc litchii]|uniref:Uncharacterized protein n=1 Tax=Leuconostoc litchii TaxID=1981069 RepID=A0A6P2CQS3_9LACO|nr:hypothetical protein [Leuconostoc litchii]TYC46619.1 hypothetical protein ESZ47_00335 [Leuconostoc litchii]GMA70480.1 hypothetical protein GCM10025879_17260 [Leuconostoc litchii]